ncbi:MAG: PBECR4 domain-containing protein [Eubacterium sp.]|nr:PBECR4 domain-containing protein [Eubacterium sp.]
MLNVSDAAISYDKMKTYNYEFIVTKDRKSPNLKITFSFSNKENFSHLCGLHYLKNYDTIKKSDRRNILDNILKGRISDDFFQDDMENFAKIQDRIDCLLHLEEIFDSPNTVFKFIEQKYNRKTSIKGEYLIKHENDDCMRFFIVVCDDKSKKYVGISCFSRDNSGLGEKDFSKNHKQYYILYKAKLTVDKNGQEIDRKELFVADSFRKELEEMKEAGKIKSPVAALSSATSTALSDNSGNGSNTQSISLSPQHSHQFSCTYPRFSPQAAIALSPPPPSPLAEMLKSVIGGLEKTAEKISAFLSSSSHQIHQLHKDKRTSPVQAHTSVSEEKTTNWKSPEIASHEAVTKQEPSKPRTWKEMLSSAAKSADEFNKAHAAKREDKPKDKNQSL